MQGRTPVRALEAADRALLVDAREGEPLLELHGVGCPDPRQVAPGLVVTAHQDVLAVVDVFARFTIEEGGGAAPELASGLEHEHPRAALGQCARGGQAGAACPDDDHVWRRHLATRSPPDAGEEAMVRIHVADGESSLVEPGNAHAPREHVVLARGDAGQQVAIDRAHDAGRHQPARVLRRQRGVGASELLARAERLSFEQGRNRRREPPRPQVVFGHAVGRQFVERQVQAAAGQIGRHVAQDVGQLEGQAQFLGVAAGARILVAEDLDADEADRGGDLVAVGPQVAERGETRRLEVHRAAVDELLERQPLHGKAADHPLQRLALRRARPPAVEAGGHFLAPALQSGRALRQRPLLVLVHLIVHGPAEVPHGRDGLAAIGGQGQERVGEVGVATPR